MINTILITTNVASWKAEVKEGRLKQFACAKVIDLGKGLLWDLV